MPVLTSELENPMGERSKDARYVTFQMADVLVSKRLFLEIIDISKRL